MDTLPHHSDTTVSSHPNVCAHSLFRTGTVVGIFLLMLLVPLVSQAQHTRLFGRVFDSDAAEPLSYATVQVLKADTTQLVAGGVTSQTGNYVIKNVSPGNYVVKISYIGYHNFFRAVTVKEKQLELNVGTVMMIPSSVMLQDLVVTGTLKEVEVKEDTLIFNAGAFKVPEGSVLEDLIKKLPGVEVSDDGTVKINGKTVSKILVEGKEFFGNDKSMSLKNLPSNIVDKVKSYDKQSDMARMTGIDDGEEETVIDLTIKKGMKQGWFGNVDLAGGTRDRYSEKAMINRFKDQTQASVIGSFNNVNDRGFSGGRGGGGANGVVKRQQVGGNFALERGDWEIGGNVRYNGSSSDSWTRTSSQNFVTTRTSFSNSFNQNRNRNHSTTGDFRLEWKPDSMTTLNFRPAFSFGGSDSRGTGLSATFNADPYDTANSTEAETTITNPLAQFDLISDAVKVNLNRSGSLSEGDNYSFNGNLILNRRLNSVGRNFSINLRANYSNNESRSYTLSDVSYYQFDDSVRLTYRYRTTPNWSKGYSVGFNYSEPLVPKTLFLQLNYRFSYSRRHSDGKAYDMGDVEYLVDSIRAAGAGYLPDGYVRYLDDELSRYTDNENRVNNVDLQLRWVTSNVNLNAGATFEHQNQRVDYDYQGLDTLASRNFIRISPTLNFRYRFHRQHTLRIRYRGNSQQPNMTDMFNMVDNSNPLNIRMGNPGLKPSFTNNLNIDWNNYVSTTMQSFTANLSLSNTLNAISNRTQYNDDTGGRITRPENINGNWNVSGNFNFHTPLFVDYLTLNLNTSARHNNNVAYLYQDNQALKNNVRQTTLSERLSVNFRKDMSVFSYDLSFNGNVSYNHTRSQLVPANNRDTYDFGYGWSGNMNFNSGFGFSTNMNMNSRRGYSSADMNTNELIWNLQASYRFLKGKAATVSLQAYDILNRRSNISRTISATQRSDTENNAIYSYVMAHFIYRFNLFGTRQSRRDMRSSSDL